MSFKNRRQKYKKYKYINSLIFFRTEKPVGSRHLPRAIFTSNSDFFPKQKQYNNDKQSYLLLKTL